MTIFHKGKTSSLRNRIEASVFLEEDEETEDETTLPRRISTCLSMSRYGRMSRMSRRYSRSSLTGASDSSLMVNPPGRARGLQTRMSRKKRDRRRSQSSGILEYRYKYQKYIFSICLTLCNPYLRQPEQKKVPYISIILSKSINHHYE